jgi:deaminated glutathione amidase
MAAPRKRWKVAAVQMTSTADVERNTRRAGRLVRAAAAAGADLIALPENFAYLRPEGAPVGFRVALDDELVLSLGRLARETRCWLLAGSIPERIPRSSRIHNTSLLFDPRGRVAASYRKLHLFDIDLAGAPVLRESRTVRAGTEPVVADTPLGRLGLSICYDLRFPELYRRLTLAGAEVLFVPSAFTSFTGPAHWLALLRARAIENQCWVVAPAQTGRHDATRASHGESAIIDPWGRVVARLPRREGWIVAEIDLGLVAAVRRGLPCLRHVRRDLLG